MTAVTQRVPPVGLPSIATLFAENGSASAPATAPRRTSELIRETFRKGPFWHSALKEVAAQVAALSATGRAELVDRLSKTPGPGSRESLLSLWVGECTTAGIGPYAGLNDHERSRLWRSLVPGQDAKHLALLWQSAMTHNLADRGAQRFRDEFIEAVGAAGTPRQRLELEQALLPGASKDYQVAGNVVQLIGDARDAAEARAAFAPLSRATMDHLVAASAKVTQSIGTDQFGGTTVDSHVDVRGFQAMAEAAAKLDSPRQKAGFVAASAGLFGKLDRVDIDDDTRTQSRGRIAASLSRVIVTDPCGIIENTLLQNTSRGGSSGRAALTGYVSSLLGAGHGAMVGPITLALRSGNGMEAKPDAYLAQPVVRGDQEPSYQRAWVLGNWIGVVNAATQSRISARDLRAGYASLMFTAGADVIKELVGVALPPLKVPASFAAAVLKPSFNAVMLNWRTELAKGDREFAREMCELALPHRASGVESTAPWVTTFNAALAASPMRL